MTPRYLLLAVLLCAAACQRPSPPLPSYGEVPNFQLTNQKGEIFHGSVLSGKIWVADFMFTSCMGPCPRMTSRLHQIQEATQKMQDVRIVSMTIDPATDTAAVLASYAKEHHASPERWTFLTGPQATLHNLSRNVFKLADVDGSLTHSTKFVLVDKKRQIRGYYDSYDPDSIEQLVKDIHTLAREQA